MHDLHRPGKLGLGTATVLHYESRIASKGDRSDSAGVASKAIKAPHTTIPATSMALETKRQGQ